MKSRQWGLHYSWSTLTRTSITCSAPRSPRICLFQCLFHTLRISIVMYNGMCVRANVEEFAQNTDNWRNIEEKNPWLNKLFTLTQCSECHYSTSVLTPACKTQYRVHTLTLCFNPRVLNMYTLWLNFKLIYHGGVRQLLALIDKLLWQFLITRDTLVFCTVTRLSVFLLLSAFSFQFSATSSSCLFKLGSPFFSARWAEKWWHSQSICHRNRPLMLKYAVGITRGVTNRRGQRSVVFLM